MKTIFLLLSGFFLLPFAGYSQAVIEISNSLKIHREEVIAIPWKDVLLAYPTIDTTNFIIINPKTKHKSFKLTSFKKYK